MADRKAIYNALRRKMEEAGFQFEIEQKPHLQIRKETELKFIHPNLINKLENEGFRTKARKFYIKPLSDDPDCEIGLVTGKSSPLYKLAHFGKANSIDSFDETPAWTNREGENALDVLLQKIIDYLNNSTQSNPNIENETKAFLLTWNPLKWRWDDLQECIERLETIGYYETRWSCGNSKSINKGDRIFLIRVGLEPKGIMASGYAKSSYYEAPHWDGTPGKTANYVDVEFDVLLNPDNKKLIDNECLKIIDPDGKQKWYSQQSGISIKKEVLSTLESYWFDLISKNNYIKESFISNDVPSHSKETYPEGKSRDIIQTRYERNPHARQICLGLHGYSCKVCGFNFEHFYGEMGKGIIHVHHINPIAEVGSEYEIDPKKDLIPVCPNCHAIIHSKKPAFTIKEIMELRESVDIKHQ